MKDRVTVQIGDDGKFNVKFNMPDIQNQDKREEFLRQIGGIIVQVFSKKILPGIAQSFANTDDDGRFIARFVDMCIELKKIAESDKRDYGADAPLVPPSKVFATGGEHD